MGNAKKKAHKKIARSEKEQLDEIHFNKNHFCKLFHLGNRHAKAKTK